MGVTVLAAIRGVTLFASFGLLHVLRSTFYATTTTTTTSDDVRSRGTMLTGIPAVVPRVQLLVAIEALCPDSQRFVQQQLTPTYATLGPHVIHLHIIPFGNAVIDEANHTVSCQHGLGECDANQYELCARWIHPQPEQHLPFINCLFYALPMSRHDDAFDSGPFEQCARLTGLSWPRIQACHGNSTQSWTLIQQAANETPKHNYVPWVVINNVRLEDESSGLLQAVCKAYAAGGGKHPACSSHATSIRIKA